MRYGVKAAQLKGVKLVFGEVVVWYVLHTTTTPDIAHPLSLREKERY